MTINTIKTYITLRTAITIGSANQRPNTRVLGCGLTSYFGELKILNSGVSNYFSSGAGFEFAGATRFELKPKVLLRREAPKGEGGEGVTPFLKIASKWCILG